METIAEPIIEPHQDEILPMASLAKRWHCDHRTAARRAKEKGLTFLYWNARVISVRLSEVLAVERAAEGEAP
jgi:hypothetical protein